MILYSAVYLQVLWIL